MSTESPNVASMDAGPPDAGPPDAGSASTGAPAGTQQTEGAEPTAETQGRPVVADPAQPGKGRRLRWIGLIAAGTVVLGVAGIAYWQSGPTALESAYEQCRYEDEPGARLADGGRTLLIETAGEEDTFGISYFGAICGFRALDAPTRVTTQVGATRALDGRITETWDEFTATWSYHPDSGLNLMITID